MPADTITTASSQQEDAGTTAGPETMQVRVRDHAGESWGHGLTSPLVRTVTISASCPRCGGRRGTPRSRRDCDDGAYYSVDVWENPCGHTDLYTEVLSEALMLRARALPEHRIEFIDRDHAGAALHHGACAEQDCLALQAAQSLVQGDMDAGTTRAPGVYVLLVGDDGRAAVSDLVPGAGEEDGDGGR